MSDLKPIGVKAPMNLLPARPLRAIAAAMEHGAHKYAPWNWQDNTEQATIDELYAALLRHTFKASDPSEDDLDDESRLHHLCHAGACVLLLLFKLGIDYQPSAWLETAKPDYVGDATPLPTFSGPQPTLVPMPNERLHCNRCGMMPPPTRAWAVDDLCPYCNPEGPA